MTAFRQLVAIAICLMLSGCSFLCELFIQNRTKKSILVTITYKVPAAEFMEKTSRMDYVPRICNPTQYRNDDRKASIKITHRSDSTLSFFIPAKSTARIERSGNHDFINTIPHN